MSRTTAQREGGILLIARGQGRFKGFFFLKMQFIEASPVHSIP